MSVILFAAPADQGTSVPLQNPLGGTAQDPKGVTEVAPFIGKIVKQVLGVVGAITLAIFVYGGFLWLTSAGNSERISKGSSTMLWAAIGVCIIFASYAILNFVITGLTGGA